MAFNFFKALSTKPSAKVTSTLKMQCGETAKGKPVYRVVAVSQETALANLTPDAVHDFITDPATKLRAVADQTRYSENKIGAAANKVENSREDVADAAYEALNGDYDMPNRGGVDAAVNGQHAK